MTIVLEICDILYVFIFIPWNLHPHTDAVEVPSKVSEKVNSLECEEENQSRSNSTWGTGCVASTKKPKRTLSPSLCSILTGTQAHW